MKLLKKKISSYHLVGDVNGHQKSSIATSFGSAEFKKNIRNKMPPNVNVCVFDKVTYYYHKRKTNKALKFCSSVLKPMYVMVPFFRKEKYFWKKVATRSPFREILHPEFQQEAKYK